MCSPGNSAAVSRDSRDLGQWLCVPPFRVVCLYRVVNLFVPKRESCKVAAIGVDLKYANMLDALSRLHHFDAGSTGRVTTLTGSLRDMLKWSRADFRRPHPVRHREIHEPVPQQRTFEEVSILQREGGLRLLHCQVRWSWEGAGASASGRLGRYLKEEHVVPG